MRRRAPSVEPKPRPRSPAPPPNPAPSAPPSQPPPANQLPLAPAAPPASAAAPSQAPPAAPLPAPPTVPASVITETFAALTRYLCDLQAHYQEQAALIGQRLDSVDARVGRLEAASPA
jgi:hypothetical protein